MIFSDSEGNLNVSRPNNPFLTASGLFESKEVNKSPVQRRSHLTTKSFEKKSRRSVAASSESVDYDEEFDEESIDNDGFNARNMPLLQSI